MLATKCNDTLITEGGERRAKELVAALPARAWQRLSVGAGAHGPRDYDWARLPIRISWVPGRGHWLLARRSLADPTEIAYYVCYGPRRSTLLHLARIAGSRWRIESASNKPKTRPGSITTKSEAGAPGMLTSPCPCSRWPGWLGSKPNSQKGNRHQQPAHDQLYGTGDPPLAQAPDLATRQPD